MAELTFSKEDLRLIRDLLTDLEGRVFEIGEALDQVFAEDVVVVTFKD